MAKAKQTGKDMCDSWTNNGKGLRNVKLPITKAQAAAINKAVDAGKKGKK